ncbi:hypothetical protein [Trichococcus collinsii]|uniref:Uncharacterized protein n=1 Tax=Trichococcus collinsii TaxID=157076 RepID=A0AB37ZXN9_9LACT|nr:hypothetical protein [Trichococcus collinsii]CZR03326.1 Hypothetical protein Tcol_2140 [Trichococcus collinsii]SDZ99262.1 hypothetical protein SAMN04488525_101810 [Trichococcus collinsii]
MKLFRKIDTTTGNFLEDVLFESHPFLMKTIQKEITLEDGATEIRVAEKPLLDEEGNTQLDPQYIDVEVPQGFYLPRWAGTEWVEGGVAPEPITSQPTVEDRLAMAEMAILDLMME